MLLDYVTKATPHHVQLTCLIKSLNIGAIALDKVALLEGFGPYKRSVDNLQIDVVEYLSSVDKSIQTTLRDDERYFQYEYNEKGLICSVSLGSARIMYEYNDDDLMSKGIIDNDNYTTREYNDKNLYVRDIANTAGVIREWNYEYTFINERVNTVSCNGKLLLTIPPECFE